MAIENAEQRQVEGERSAHGHRQWYEGQPHPSWGNCKRGCPPAYLVRGFCSPACEKGAPRGEYVTVAK